MLELRFTLTLYASRHGCEVCFHLSNYKSKIVAKVTYHVRKHRKIVSIAMTNNEINWNAEYLLKGQIGVHFSITIISQLN